MRVNVYAEEMTDRVEIVEKTCDGTKFTGLRFYLELPCTGPNGEQHQGPFIHRPGDDDSAAVTFWGKKDLREVLQRALKMLNVFYAAKDVDRARDEVQRAEDALEATKRRAGFGEAHHVGSIGPIEMKVRFDVSPLPHDLRDYIKVPGDSPFPEDFPKDLGDVRCEAPISSREKPVDRDDRGGQF